MKIKVLSTKVTSVDEKGKQKIWWKWFTPVNIEIQKVNVNGDLIESLGIQKKSLRVHFTKSAMKKFDDDKIFAIIETNDGANIQLPFVFKIIVHDDGTCEYPDSNDVWVREIDKITNIPYTPKESTCVPLVDEEPVEETEIVE